MGVSAEFSRKQLISGQLTRFKARIDGLLEWRRKQLIQPTSSSSSCFLFLLLFFLLSLLLLFLLLFLWHLLFFFLYALLLRLLLCVSLPLFCPTNPHLPPPLAPRNHLPLLLLLRLSWLSSDLHRENKLLALELCIKKNTHTQKSVRTK